MQPPDPTPGMDEPDRGALNPPPLDANYRRGISVTLILLADICNPHEMPVDRK